MQSSGWRNSPGRWHTSGPSVSLKDLKPPGPNFSQVPESQLLTGEAAAGASLPSTAGLFCTGLVTAVTPAPAAPSCFPLRGWSPAPAGLPRPEDLSPDGLKAGVADAGLGRPLPNPDGLLLFPLIPDGWLLIPPKLDGLLLFLTDPDGLLLLFTNLLLLLFPDGLLLDNPSPDGRFRVPPKPDGPLLFLPDPDGLLLLLLLTNPGLLFPRNSSGLFLMEFSDPGLLLMLDPGPDGLLFLFDPGPDGLMLLFDPNPDGLLLLDPDPDGLLLLFDPNPDGLLLLLFDPNPDGLLLLLFDPNPEGLLLLFDPNADGLLVVAAPDGLLLLPPAPEFCPCSLPLLAPLDGDT